MIDLKDPKVRKFAAWTLGVATVLTVLGYLTADQWLGVLGKVFA